MREEAFWLMPGGEMQEPVASYLKSKGYKIIISDGSNDCFLKDFADLFFQVDTFDIKGNLELAEKIKKDFYLAGVFTVAADCHEVIALLNQDNGKFFWDVETSLICKDKLKTRKFLKGLVKQPLYHQVSKFEEIASFKDFYQNNPLVLKAPDNSGSRGFRKFNNIDEIQSSDFDYSLSFAKSKFLIIESLIQPTKEMLSEISVESLWHRGDFKITNIVDRVFSQDISLFPQNLKDYKNLKEGVEIGHINPSIMGGDSFIKVKDLFKAIGKKLELNKRILSTLKLDIMFDQDLEPIVLEMTPRCSGGWDSSYSNIDIGGNLQKSLVDYLLGTKTAENTFKGINKGMNKNMTCFVLGHSESDSEDSIGRVFYSANSDKKNISDLIEECINKRNQGEKIVRIPI